MDRSSVMELRDSRWEFLYDQRDGDGNRRCDLEVEIIPSEMPDTSISRITGVMPDTMEQDVCSRAFVNFRNYTDGDKPIENSLEARLELYRMPAIRSAINNALQAANTRFILGEDDAVSG